MSSIVDVAALVRAVGDAGTFEAGSELFLDALRDRIEHATTAGAGARGLVHLRSEQAGYRALVVREWGELAGRPVAPSATVWSWVDRLGGLALDLTTGRGISLRSAEPIVVAPAYVAHEPAGSVVQMMERDATHLVALPLKSGGPTAGMACLELTCPGLAWPEGGWAQELEATADLVAPLLLRLPLAPEEGGDEAPDPLLPVVGARTRPLLPVLHVFAQQDETLLFSGPTGSGKSWLARLCHERSPRRERAFETANLLALPEPMQMGELFGWRRGAFTGAHADHEGLLAQADGGTLFLDEIDKLSLAAQAGLLRVIETRRFSPLGATRERPADVRFVVGTNADLRRLVAEGAFRQDLYYRINVLPIRLEGLVERTDEIPGWAGVFLQRRHAERSGSGRARFADEALGMLATASWPGNLRQLDNVVRRAYALGLTRGAHEPFVVGADDVRAALALESGGESSSAGALLVQAANAIVEHALAARREGRTIALDDLDQLRALVLRAAADRLGSVKDAYLLFGAETLVRGRNHTANYQKLAAALTAFEAHLAR